MRVNCHIPVTLRITGVPTEDQLAAAGAALTRAVAARLAEAERLLASRHGHHGLTGSHIREPYDPAREETEGYAVPSYGQGGDPVVLPKPPAAVGPYGLPAGADPRDPANPHNTLTAEEMFDLWMRYWTTRHNQALAHEREVWRKTFAIIRKDRDTLVKKSILFRNGHRDVYGPEYQAAVDELDYSQATAGAASDLKQWLEVKEKQHTPVTFDQVNEAAASIVRGQRFLATYVEPWVFAGLGAKAGPAEPPPAPALAEPPPTPPRPRGGRVGSLARNLVARAMIGLAEAEPATGMHGASPTASEQPQRPAATSRSAPARPAPTPEQPTATRPAQAQAQVRVPAPDDIEVPEGLSAPDRQRVRATVTAAINDAVRVAAPGGGTRAVPGHGDLGSQPGTPAAVAPTAASAAPAAPTTPATPATPTTPAAATAPATLPELADEFLADLQVAGEVAELALEELLAVPLTSEEMYHMLLLRRAAPLSVPISVANEAPAAIEAIDGKIVTVDETLARVTKALAEARQQHGGAKGDARATAAARVQELQKQAGDLASQRKQLLAEKVRLTRGRALATEGRGAPSGTGQITYATIQVVDARGRRVALEAAETTATEHAEERMLTRLRARFARDQLVGARMTVVGDQKVCEARCRPALIAFATDYHLDHVESRYFTRPRIGRPGQASPRTTLRTATEASSAGLPVTEHTEEIYHRPGAPSGPPAARPAAAGDETASQAAGHEAAAKSAGGTAPEEATAARPRPTAQEPQAGSTAPRVPATFAPSLPTAPGTRAAIGQATEMLFIDIVLDLLLAKYQKWRDDKNLRSELEMLQPEIESAKQYALNAFRHDPWAGGTSGQYYNVVIRISSKSTTVVGGGRALRIPGSPRPQLIRVTISSNNLNEVLSHDEAVRVLGLSEGATGALLQGSDVQLVIYSEPVAPD